MPVPDPSVIGYEDCTPTPPTPDPAVTGYEQCAAYEHSTFCDLDVENNVWVEGVVDLATGKRGICMLDTLTRRQVVGILQHDPRAREDLPKVTSNPEVLQILAETRLLPSRDLLDDLQSRSARNPAAIPFYTVFRGRPPTARK